MSYPFPYSGPIPPETNPTIEPQYFKPSRFVISDISLGLATLITTAVNHNYVVGQEIRISIPPFYGTYQLSGQQGFVTSIPAPNQVLVNINSVGFSNYIPKPIYGPTPPQIISIGDIANGGINASGRTNQALAIPGSFVNISPQ
jgi:hypothetical protein